RVPEESEGARGEWGDTDGTGPQGRIERGARPHERAAGPAGPGGVWSRAEWLPCCDGKARPAEPGIFPLADGVPNRVGTRRGAGNAIVPPVAAEFIKAYREVIGEDVHGL